MTMSDLTLTELRKLQPSAIWEGYILDSSNIPGGGILRFHAGTNGLRQSVVWQGDTYAPFPIIADGFSMTGQGVLPRPTLKVSNVGGVMAAYCAQYQDFIGAIVTRRRVHVKYLDAVNFGGYNPDANVNAGLDDDVFEVQQKVSETEDEIVFQLSCGLDLQSRVLPARQVAATTCLYTYRRWVSGTTFDYTGVDQCPYAGSNYYDKSNAATTAQNDACARTIPACQLRFPGKQALPFGGFPGTGILTS